MIRTIKTRDGLLHLVEIITNKYVNTLDIYNDNYILIHTINNCQIRNLNNNLIEDIIYAQKDYEELNKIKNNN